LKTGGRNMGFDISIPYQIVMYARLSSPNDPIGDMVSKAVRTRFPIRIASGMTE
jgi:hypothetical protein